MLSFRMSPERGCLIFSERMRCSPAFKPDVERQLERLQEALQVGRAVPPLVPGRRRLPPATQPQRSEFLEDDRVGRGGNFTATR